jgi:hypothetical protein
MHPAPTFLRSMFSTMSLRPTGPGTTTRPMDGSSRPPRRRIFPIQTGGGPTPTTAVPGFQPILSDGRRTTTDVGSGRIAGCGSPTRRGVPLGCNGVRVRATSDGRRRGTATGRSPHSPRPIGALSRPPACLPWTCLATMRPATWAATFGRRRRSTDFAGEMTTSGWRGPMTIGWRAIGWRSAASA